MYFNEQLFFFNLRARTIGGKFCAGLIKLAVVLGSKYLHLRKQHT
jgi:hypothetical protein